MTNCPFCNQDIREASLKCDHCGEWVDLDKRAPTRRLAAVGETAGTGVQFPLKAAMRAGIPRVRLAVAALILVAARGIGF